MTERSLSATERGEVVGNHGFWGAKPLSEELSLPSSSRALVGGLAQSAQFGRFPESPPVSAAAIVVMAALRNYATRPPPAGRLRFGVSGSRLVHWGCCSEGASFQVSRPKQWRLYLARVDRQW